MGLDRDDAIIRRRLRQKLEFLVEDAVDQVAPTDAQLQAWLEKHTDTFTAEPRVALRQVYVSTERRRAAAWADAEKLLVGCGPPVRTRRSTCWATRRCYPTSCRSDPLRGEPGVRDGVRRQDRRDRAGSVDWPRRISLRPAPGSGARASGLRAAGARGCPAHGRARAAGERRRSQLQALYEKMLAKYTVTIEMPKEERKKVLADRGGRRPAVRRRPPRLRARAGGRLRCARPRGTAGLPRAPETGSETYSFLWKKPTGGEVEIQIAPVIPDGCRLETPDRQQLTPGAVIVRGTLTCAGGLAGRRSRSRASRPRSPTSSCACTTPTALESHLLRPPRRR